MKNPQKDMVTPIIRSNGDVIYPKGAVLPKTVQEKPVYEGSIRVVEAFDRKSEVVEPFSEDDLAPDRPFRESLDAINKDPRLNLSMETYAQYVVADGFRVTAKSTEIEDLVNDWLDDIGFNEMLEDGIPSYLGVGNLIYEHDPSFTEYVEVPVTTVESIVRNAKGKIKYYKQHINNNDIRLKPETITHFKLTNVAAEPFARGLPHSVLNSYTNPDNGEVYDSPLIQTKKMEDAMPKIFEAYASPLMMFHFEDAGEQFIKTQADQLKKAKPGMKIVTDKKFDVEKFEVAGNSKFDGYIEHIQRDLLEPGSKFPLQFFNAGFTARAASESSESVFGNKVKRIQKRLANQIVTLMIIPYLRARGKKTKIKDIQGFFDVPVKNTPTLVDVLTAYRDNGIKRSELRQWLLKFTSIDIDQDDMENLPPITSVTPTNDMGSDDSEEEPVDTDDTDDTKEMVQELKMKLLAREELDSSNKRKNTQEILEFIRDIK